MRNVQRYVAQRLQHVDAGAKASGDIRELNVRVGLRFIRHDASVSTVSFDGTQSQPLFSACRPTPEGVMAPQMLSLVCK